MLGALVDESGGDLVNIAPNCPHFLDECEVHNMFALLLNLLGDVLREDHVGFYHILIHQAW